MPYYYTSALAEHFRNNGNQWQNAVELQKALDINYTDLRARLTQARMLGCLQTKGEPGMKRYRFRPAALELERVPPPQAANGARKQLEAFTQAFCQKWQVRYPYQATARHPEALGEWLDGMDGLAANKEVRMTDSPLPQHERGHYA